jgi:hypothetical protein
VKIFLFSFIAILILFSSSTKAEETKPNYSFVYKDGILLAKNAETTLQGKRGWVEGNFSYWWFEGKNFGVVFNTKTQKMIDITEENWEAGGPFRIMGYDKYILLDYGTGPDPRYFALIDEDGNTVYQDSYWSIFPIGFQKSEANGEYGEIYLSYVGSTPSTDKAAIEKCTSEANEGAAKPDPLYKNIPDALDVRYVNINKKKLIRTMSLPTTYFCKQ